MTENEIHRLLDDADEETYLSVTPVTPTATDVPMVFIKVRNTWQYIYKGSTGDGRAFSAAGIAKAVWDLQDMYHWSLS